MKSLGILMVVLGLVVAIYAFNMDISVTAPARDFGYGVRTPEATVVNLELISRRQNTLISGGILAIIGAIFAAVGSRPVSQASSPEKEHFREPVRSRTDRVEFHDGSYTVGEKTFGSYEEADTYLKKG